MAYLKYRKPFSCQSRIPYLALLGMAQLAVCRPANQNIAGLTPVRAHAWVEGSVSVRKTTIYVSLSHRCFIPLFLPPLSSL